MLTLARLLRDAGSHHEAESLLRTSLSIQNRSSDKDEARIARTEFDLAIVLDRVGEADSARHLWEKVLTTADRTDGPESQLSRQAATNLAITLRKLGRYGDEFGLRVRVLESTSDTRSGPTTWTRHRSMVDLAQTQRSLGNHEMALGLFVEAVDGLERGGEEPRTILYQKWAIASELMALKRHKEASLMFDQVVAGADCRARSRRSLPQECGPPATGLSIAGSLLIPDKIQKAVALGVRSRRSQFRPIRRFGRLAERTNTPQ